MARESWAVPEKQKKKNHELLDDESSCWWINYNRIGICRRALDAEMKDATKEGLQRKNLSRPKKKKNPGSSADSLLYTVHVCN